MRRPSGDAARCASLLQPLNPRQSSTHLQHALGEPDGHDQDGRVQGNRRAGDGGARAIAPDVSPGNAQDHHGALTCGGCRPRRTAPAAARRR